MRTPEEIIAEMSDKFEYSQVVEYIYSTNETSPSLKLKYGTNELDLTRHLPKTPSIAENPEYRDATWYDYFTSSRGPLGTLQQYGKTRRITIKAISV